MLDELPGRYPPRRDEGGVMRKLILAAAAAVLVLASCGGEGDELGSDAATDDESSLSIQDVRTRLSDSGMQCGEVGPYVPAEDELDLGVQPSEMLECSVGDGTVTVSGFETAAEATALLALVTEIACSFESSTATDIVNGSTWYLEAKTSAGEPDSDLLSAAAEAVEIEPSAVECEGSETTTTASPEDLQPADEVTKGEMEQAMFAEPIEPPSSPGVVVTVSNPRAGGDDLGAWLEVDVRIENRGSAELPYPPQIGLVCDGSTENGGSQADQSLDTTSPVPAASFIEGTLHLVPPGDARTGDPVTPCIDPAAVVVDDEVSIPVDPELVAQLNAGI